MKIEIEFDENYIISYNFVLPIFFFYQIFYMVSINKSNRLFDLGKQSTKNRTIIFRQIYKIHRDFSVILDRYKIYSNMKMFAII